MKKAEAITRPDLCLAWKKGEVQFAGTARRVLVVNGDLSIQFGYRRIKIAFGTRRHNQFESSI